MSILRKIMNSVVLFCVIYLTICTKVEHLESEAKFSQSDIENISILKEDSADLILPGMGFSSDMEKQSSTQCFNYLSVTKSNQRSYIHYDQSLSYSTLVNEFDLKSKIEGGYKAFKASAEVNYLNSVKDSKYSISLNYFQKIVSTVTFTYSYDPLTMLNETGKNIYNNGQNKMFRLFCGDRLIKSYDEGAGLIFSLVISFSSEEEKKVFENNNQLGFGQFATITAKIKKTTEDRKTEGTVRIDAFQYGGKPIELSKILSGSIAVCDITKIEECQNTIKRLVEYASKDFPLQFENKGDQNPLVNTGKIENDFEVTDFGLTLTPSFVTDEVAIVRKSLTRDFKKMNYYLTKLKVLKVEFKSSKIDYNALIDMTEKLINDLNKGVDLYNFPHRATEIYTKIKHSINYDAVEKKIVDVLDFLRYYVQYDDLFKTEIHPLGSGFYKCKQSMIIFYRVMCIALDFNNFVFTVTNDLIGVPMTYTGTATLNQSKNVYEGQIKSGVEPINITGKRLEYQYAVKRYEEVEEDN